MKNETPEEYDARVWSFLKGIIYYGSIFLFCLWLSFKLDNYALTFIN